jgi:septal ring factor EnvC (AmiA/AmiB activator)
MFLGLSITATVSLSAEQTTDPAELERKLQALESEINKFKAMLDRTRGEKSTIEGNLETNEKNINDLLKKIQTIETDLAKGENKISRLTDEQKELHVAKSEQQEHIGQQIRAAYQIGNQEYLKVLLNQEDPNKISRMLTYYDYFNRARARQIESYNETIVQLRNITRLIETENLILEDNRKSLQVEQKEVIRVQIEKRKILVTLNREISTTGKALDKKIGDRDQLEQLIERIQAGIVNLPGPKDLLPFGTLKGQLLLPVAGRISHRYGNNRFAGKLKWSGVMIEAPEGEPVHAVHYGRVVFSDWLRGFGLLLIINHGEGYMSLYGHNQVLYRETGEWVTAGETIATVGDTGGQKRSGLYFEIRVEGKTADPQLWCRARSERAA